VTPAKALSESQTPSSITGTSKINLIKRVARRRRLSPFLKRCACSNRDTAEADPWQDNLDRLRQRHWNTRDDQRHKQQHEVNDISYTNNVAFFIRTSHG
jgi:hypothetical protein